MMLFGTVLERFFSVNLKLVYRLAGSMSLERVDLGKVNFQLIANEENQDRIQRGKK
jgi:hypothetical protein